MVEPWRSSAKKCLGLGKVVVKHTTSFKDAKVLITGGMGFIGSNLARRQIEQGAEVVLVDNLHVYHQYVVRCEQRDALRKFLHENGIGTLFHYPVPVQLQPAYRDIAVPLGGLHNSEEAAIQVLSLPMYAELSPVQIHSVTEAILTWDRSKAIPLNSQRS